MSRLNVSNILIVPNYMVMKNFSWKWNSGHISHNMEINKNSRLYSEEEWFHHYTMSYMLFQIHPWVHDWYAKKYNVKGWDFDYVDESFKFCQWRGIPMTKLTHCLEFDELVDPIVGLYKNKNITEYEQIIGTGRDESHKISICKDDGLWSIKFTYCGIDDEGSDEYIPILDVGTLEKYINDLKEVSNLLNYIELKKEGYSEYLDHLANESNM